MTHPKPNHLAMLMFRLVFLHPEAATIATQIVSALSIENLIDSLRGRTIFKVGNLKTVVLNFFNQIS